MHGHFYCLLSPFYPCRGSFPPFSIAASDAASFPLVQPNDKGVNRISRFQYDASSPATTLSSEEIILESSAKASDVHSAGWISFKPSAYSAAGVRVLQLYIVAPTVALGQPRLNASPWMYFSFRNVFIVAGYSGLLRFPRAGSCYVMSSEYLVYHTMVQFSQPSSSTLYAFHARMCYSIVRFDPCRKIASLTSSLQPLPTPLVTK